MARVRCALALLVATAAAFAPLSGAPGRRNLQPTVDPATPAAPPALAHAPRWLHRGAVARQMTTLPLEEGGMGPLMVGLLNPTSLDVIEETWRRQPFYTVLVPDAAADAAPPELKAG